MNKKTRSVLRTVILVLVAILIGASVYSINAARLAGNTLPMPLGFGATVVLSGSMEPALSVGDLLIVVPEDEYNVGDIVVYQASGIAVVHRIVEIDGDTVITQGDANNAPDEPILLTCVKGKVVAAIPFVGYIVEMIQTPIVTVILIALAIWLMEASFGRDKAKDSEERERIMKEIERLKESVDSKIKIK